MKIFLIFSFAILSQACTGSFQALSQGNAQNSSAASLPNQTLSAVLDWDQSSSVNIQGYRIYIGSQSGVYDRVIDVGQTANPTQPEYEVLNLDPNSNSYAVVKAYDQAGKESLASNEIVINAN